MKDLRMFSSRIILAGSILALSFVLLLGLTAQINGQALTATATWNAVTTNSNGGTLTCSVTYNVLRGAKSDGSDLAVLNTAPITTTTYVDSTILSLAAVYYYAVNASCGGYTSGNSALVRFSKGDEVPSSPGSLIIH